jgi:AcrR family transcriptional regulator
MREPDEDRRVRRTQGLLRRAIASLVHEKPYDAIAVKEILARADVGRSAFYAHFRDKDALLASAVRETLRASASRASAADPIASVLGFSGPLFEHVGGRLVAERGSGGVARHEAVHECLRGQLAEWVADALRRVGTGRAGAPPVPLDLLAAHVADTFLRVLVWWVERGAPGSAREADRLFRVLVTPAVADAVR